MVIVIPIIIGALGTIPKGLVKRQEDLDMRGQVETIQTTALLRTVRILRRVLETWGDLLSLKLDKETRRPGHKKTSGNHSDYSIIKKRILISVPEAWGDLLSLKLDKETGTLGHMRRSGNHPDYSIIKNC